MPGVVDYTDEADAAFERYAAAGMHVVRSTDPIEQWPIFAKSSSDARAGRRRWTRRARRTPPCWCRSTATPLTAVFTERRADLRRHAGEISFPGGRQDHPDEDLRSTALREAEEEIGLDPAGVELVGALPPVGTFVTGYRIFPFVGIDRAGPDVAPPGHRGRAGARVHARRPGAPATRCSA